MIAQPTSLEAILATLYKDRALSDLPYEPISHAKAEVLAWIKAKAPKHRDTLEPVGRYIAKFTERTLGYNEAIDDFLESLNES